MSDKRNFCTCRDFKIEILHNFLCTGRVVEINTFEFNFALFNSFYRSIYWFPDIKCRDLIDYRKDWNSRSFSFLDAWHVCSLSAHTHISKEKQIGCGEDFC